MNKEIPLQANKPANKFPDILKRAIFGALFLLITIGTIYFSLYAWIALAAVYSLGCLYEFSERNPEMGKLKWPTRISAVVVWLCVFLFLYLDDLRFVLFPVFFSPLFLLYALSVKEGHPFKELSAFFVALIYTVFPFIALVLLGAKIDGYRPELIIWFFLLIWANDSFAYLFGRLFGKHKMAPSISPGKSWEGFAGGAIMSLIFHVLISYYFIPIHFIHAIALVLLGIPLAVLGDLVESKWKRNLNIKDSGHFLPGHGGFLDRFDSVLISAPVIFFYFYALKNYLFI